MAGVSALLPFQWRAYWRSIRARSAWAGANMTMVLILGLLMIPSLFAGCIFAAARMRGDAAGQGVMFAEILLLSIFLAWFMLPILAAGIEARGQAVAPIRLLQFPLSTRQLFLIGVSGTLVQPIYWVLILASALCLIPLLAGPSPALGLTAGLLFIATSALVSWGVTLLGSALFASRRGREIAMATMTLFLIGIILMINLDIEMEQGVMRLEGLGQSILLMSADGSEGLLARGRSWLPTAWTARAALGEIVWIPMLALLAAAAFAMSYWSLRHSIRHPQRAARGRGRLRAIAPLPGLPPVLGSAARKEFNYLSRTMDAMLGLTLGLGGAGYLLLKSAPSILVLFFGIPVILLVISAMPMNCFGLDGRAVDRYRLLPLSGREVILSKNLAYFFVSALQLLPLILAGAIRFGPVTGLAAICFASSILLLFVLWGNSVSIRVPAPREFFNFDSKEQAGGIISQFYAMLIWGIPGGVAMATQALGSLALLLGQLLFLALCLLVYRRRLAAAGRLFETKSDTMRDRLAV